MTRLAIFACIAIFLVSCSQKNYLSIVQDNREVTLRDENIQTISLKKTPFKIQAKIKPYDEAKNEFYKISLIASENPDLFSKIKVGDVIGDESIYSPGMGMAADFGGGSLFVADDGFNSLYYEQDESLGCPMKLVKKSGGDYVAAATVNILAVDGDGGWNRRSVAQYRANKLYLLFFYDRDLNRVIDKGKLHKVTINFQSP